MSVVFWPFILILWVMFVGMVLMFTAPIYSLRNGEHPREKWGERLVFGGLLAGVGYLILLITIGAVIYS